MKKNIIILFSIFLFSACSKKNYIRGEGPISTQNRTQSLQSEIRSIKINGSTEAQIMYGPVTKLEVSGYNNLLAALSTEVVGNTLVVEYKELYNVKNDNTKIILTVPNLPSLQLNGSIKTSITGIFPSQESVYFRVSGSAKINAEGTNTNVNHAEYSISGSGEIFAYDILSKDFEGNISGKAEMRTSVFNNLNASISGSGVIYYKGNPTVSSNISGSGKVIKVN